MNFDLFTKILVADENIRYKVYDDATGLEIKPGTLVQGHPTIGIGRCLDKKGISPRESAMFIQNDTYEISEELYKIFPWFEELDEVRQVVLGCMAFQMGIDELLGFHETLQAVEYGAYAKAAQEMLDSDWARKETPARAKRLSEMMRTGKVG
jgi:lysozyme